MKKLIRNIDEYTTLYRDDRSGIAWIEDGTTGLGISIHASISDSGSVRGMKNCGYWRKFDRTIRNHGFIYNIDTLSYDKNNALERMLVSAECKCAACIERRGY